MIERIEIKLTQDRELKYHTVAVVSPTVDGADMFFLITELLRPLMKLEGLKLAAEEDEG